MRAWQVNPDLSRTLAARPDPVAVPNGIVVRMQAAWSLRLILMAKVVSLPAASSSIGGSYIGIANADGAFDFLNGADPTACFNRGLFGIDTFFRIADGDAFSRDFDIADVFDHDSLTLNDAAVEITGSDPGSGGELGLVPTGKGAAPVAEPSTFPVLLSGLFLFATCAICKRRRKAD